MNAYKTVIAATVAMLLTGPALAQSNQSMQGMNKGSQGSQPIIGKGVVKKVDPAKRTVNLNHEAIPAINWPAMTMDFQVVPNLDLSKVQLGQPVDFRLEKGNGGNYTVTSISPAAK